MLIIGAGMSGLLAGQYFRSQMPTIIERQDSLPNNHSALLRFRSNSVSDLTGIGFRKVRVQKAISYKGKIYNEANIKMNNLYSAKVTNTYNQRSISSLESCDRCVAPGDFIQKASNGLDITYSEDASTWLSIEMKEPIISTMPVMALAKLLDYELDVELESTSITTTRMTIPDDCDVYQTIYYPDLEEPFYRISITGNRVIAESMFDRDSSEYLGTILQQDFGIKAFEDTETTINTMKYGKLIEHKGKEIKDFIIHATNEHNIYSLGRWGTHRQILMDDVVHDLKIIGKLINRR